ncbi:porin [Corallincola spongiicola]|uniref:Porin n=1 Tax=Corallincola spongiicola TaxID=2520508 RepID=A0ABY1WQC5_9GAMM|nr:porin [Corallincola spongiicola]TAA46935.1 porin [Corallincola spongiicola]
MQSIVKRSPITIAFLTSASIPLTAHANVGVDEILNGVQVYGKLNLSWQVSDEGDGSFTDMSSNASRFGLKGDVGVNDDLSVIYQLEYEAVIEDGDDTIKNRNQFVGLHSKTFGTGKIGRHDTMLKMSQGKVDQFNDFEGDLKYMFVGENRMSETLTYISPSLAGFTLGMTWVATGADNESDSVNGESDSDGFSTALMYGDSKLNSTPFYAAVAYDDDVNNFDTIRTTAQARLANLTVGGMWQESERSDGTGSAQSSWLASAAYQLTHNVSLRSQYQQSDMHKLEHVDGSRPAVDFKEGYSVGASYDFSKKTALYAWYTDRTAANSSSKSDSDYFSVGISHSF